jgi:predicted TIM-barrel fold metal-dependent hydrolase
MQRIDLHAHIFPPVFLEADERHGGLLSSWLPLPGPDALLATMDRYDIRASVLSLPFSVALGGDLPSPDLARLINEYYAELVGGAPDRFGALAALSLPDVEAALAELSYALDELGLDGVAIATGYGDTYLGEPAFDDLFDELERRQAYVFVHPPGRPPDPLGRFFGPWLLELPFHTTRSVINLIFSGTLERCPNVKLQFAHMGGTAPYLAPRLDECYARFPEAAEVAPARADYLKHLYWDTGLSAGPATMAAALESSDVDHIVFGTDWPFDLARPTDGRDPVPGLEAFGAEVRSRVEWQNAATLVPRLASGAKS